MNFNIWEGIYDNFKQCPKQGKGFESDRWVSQQLRRINGLLDSTKESQTVSSVVTYRMNLLPFLAALLSEKKKIDILDFGGGLGGGYIPIICSCVEEQSVDYHIVETENICEAGRRVFKDDKRIHFYASLPEEKQTMDIIHLSSSLQYVEDWKSLINALAGYEPQYFLFTDLSAGDIPTYATVQNYYESKIPYWFFSIDDIIAAMSSVSFRLLFKSTYVGVILGQEQGFQQDNFPKEYRLGNSCNLLFSRDKT